RAFSRHLPASLIQPQRHVRRIWRSSRHQPAAKRDSQQKPKSQHSLSKHLQVLSMIVSDSPGTADMKMTAAVKATILTIFPPSGHAQAESRPAVHSPALPSIEAVILDRLLAELNTREVARVQPPYLMERQPSSETTRL